MVDSIAIKGVKDDRNNALDLTASHHDKVVPKPHESYGPTGASALSLE